VHGLADMLEVDLPATHRRTDAELVAAAINALAWDVTVPEDGITVTIADGRLTLEGEVPWRFQKEHAGRTVGQLTGVREVVNDIRIKAPATAADVKRKIQAVFQRSAELDANALSVELHDGCAVIRGPVHSWPERDRVTRAAYSVAGVTKVENHTYFVQR
jgi:osmotically-inducible protein OsmY